MDLITTETLQKILTARSEWSISLYMPAQRLGRETEQNPIRFKNLLRETEKRLMEKGLQASEIESMLKAPRSLQEGYTFWQHQSDGLALFFSQEEFHLFRLPVPFKEAVFVTDRFHIKPLLPLLNSDGTFHILAISQNQVRLFEGTRQTVDEIDLLETPDTLSESYPDDWPKQKFQFQTMGTGGGGHSATTHAHATGTDLTVRLKKWFRTIDKEVAQLLSETRSPLVLAGVETLFPVYAEVNTYPNLVDEGIAGNPDEMNAKDLHAKAWAIVEPIFTKDRETNMAKFRQLAGTGKTTTSVTDAVLAAHRGQVETLFVAHGVEAWGTFDPETEKVKLSDGKQAGDEDLLDLAAGKTLVKGGSVFALSPQDIPDNAHVAALLRY
ncbi:MAG: hypothetical protein RBR15_11150 [Sphaerochaeta sp.]|nr:hypothetical protein [Sphaerochaeta sp.]